MRDKIYLFLTICLVPIYWVKAQFLHRTDRQEAKNKEFLRYGSHYLGFRRNKVNISGTPLNEPAIYICNHQSMNDIFILIKALNQPFRFVAKRELFDSKLTGIFMRMTQSYALDRSDPRQSLSLLKTAVADANEHTILVFPEGTRSRTSEMLPFKDGLFSVIRRAQVPIVPIFIHNSYKKDQRVYDVSFGQPILPETYQGLKGQELSSLCYNTLETLRLTYL